LGKKTYFQSLADEEQGLAASFYTYGYRLGMLLASAGGLILADIIGFARMLQLCAALYVSLAVYFLLRVPPLHLPEDEAAVTTPHGASETLQRQNA